MSDNGDRTCPLCAEEMDLTDQQLKPCKCGYEICVWCWHQIMDMAEKENSEGRCPACRTSYDKERIVGMAVNCERLVIESNTEKRYKTQKTKLKMSADARKNLSRVRVVQRNLVYIIGLPSHLADESVLERREYFGQYGKILKVSISWLTATAQQASSNCFSVYITYAREEDAVRCIQSVHNYTLEGKSLRACFGTTKYCHSWLRNMTCSNPDCLYLHDIGCQEDSFTKDEIISAYSRSRVPQVALNNLQRRAGNILPPPADDLGTDGTASSKTCLRMSSNNTINHVKSADVSSGRSKVLPATASWGSRVSNNCSPATSTPCLQNAVKQKLDVFNSSTQFHSSTSSIKCISAWNDHVSVSSKVPDNRAVDDGSRTLEPLKHASSMHDHPVVSDDLSETSVVAESSLMISAWDDDTTTKAPGGRKVMHMDSESRPQEPQKENVTRDEMTSGLGKSTEIFLDEACNYAWDDDIDTTSNQITDSSFLHLDGNISSLDTLRSYSDRDSQTSLSEDTAVGDTSCTSGVSCSSSQFLGTLTGDKDGLVTHEIVSMDSVNVKSLECNDSLSERLDCDDVISNIIALKEDIKSVCLGISAVNFNSHLVVDQQSKDKYQVQSSSNCSNFSSGSSAIKLCQNYPDKEAERLSSVPTSHASVATDSQFFMDLPGWSPNQQSNVPLAMEKGENYSLANDGQRGKMSNVSIRMPFSSCSLNPPDISCFPTNSSCKEDTCDSRCPIVANSLDMNTMVDQELFTLRDHNVLPVVPKQDQQDDYVMQREVFEIPDMRCTENKPRYLVKYDDLATIKTENIDSGEGNIISNMLSLDFDPWDDSLQSANNFAKLLNGMDKKGGSSTLSSSWKLQNNNQSRFSFARQENSANVSATYSPSASHVEKLSSSTQESFRDGYHNNVLLNTIGGPSSVVNRSSVFSSNNSTGTLRPKMPTPPGFSVPHREPPPGFSSQGCSAASENLFHGSPIPNQFELHSVRNAGDVEFIDPAILAVGKGILPLEVNNSGLGLTSVIPSQFCTVEGNRIQSLMQHSIAAHHDLRVSNNTAAVSTMHDAYISSRFPMQINTSYSPFIHHQQLRTSNILNSQWSGWPNVLNDSGVGMDDIVKNDRFGLDNFTPMKEEQKFRLSSSTDLYTRPYGIDF